MRPALLLIDLQNDFLNGAGLTPARGIVVERTLRLLRHCREHCIPVIHVWTTANHEKRMPHWKEANKLACMDGTDGHSSPKSIAPLASEKIVHKVFFSGFSNADLDPMLRSLKVDTLLIAGVHVHGCIRSTILDAYKEGYQTLVAEDAIASDDPLHAAVTQRYLETRAATFHSVEELCATISKLRQAQESTRGDKSGEDLLHFSPRQNDCLLWKMASSSQDQIEAGIARAREFGSLWKSVAIEQRLTHLMRLADLVEENASELSNQIAIEIGKPVAHARAEIAYAVQLLRALSSTATEDAEIPCAKDITVRYRPLGTVALVTPWNNPVAIPLGKIGPALLYGNAVVWKPAPAASNLAMKIMGLLRSTSIPADLISVAIGDRSTALRIMGQSGIDAVSLAGSLAAGYAAQDICARRHIPLQAELGGNNASIVWNDCDLADAARRIAESAFGFAGQRCTANRRAIVHASCHAEFLQLLEQATAELIWGDPLDESTQIGPVISRAKCDSLLSLVDRAKESAEFVSAPHQTSAKDMAAGAYFSPTIIGCDDPQAEIVQEESFGPILVVQKAENWDHAISLCNGVKQGLAASLFSQSKEIQSAFMEQAQSGILKLNSGTANAAAEAPFGGWKASGIGPPEHGSADREFYTRTQAIYR